jgi:hypothetical protein
MSNGLGTDITSQTDGQIERHNVQLNRSLFTLQRTSKMCMCVLLEIIRLLRKIEGACGAIMCMPLTQNLKETRDRVLGV